VFTDIEGSTALWDQTPDAMTESLAEHDRRIRSIVDRHDGYVFSTAGDSFAASFQTAAEAVEAALDVQLALREPAAGLTLKVRIGVHSGTATIRNDDYFGSAVNQGRLDEAERDYRESLAEARRADHAHSIAIAMGGLGRTLIASGQAGAARPILVEARERFQELTVAPGIVDADIFLGVAERDLGDPQAAAQHLLAALSHTGIHWFDDADFWTLHFAASISPTAPPPRCSSEQSSLPTTARMSASPRS
jgi:tetratricopeptide (TPR) repeat protein